MTTTVLEAVEEKYMVAGDPCGEAQLQHYDDEEWHWKRESPLL
jgi:hypothetical protein